MKKQIIILSVGALIIIAGAAAWFMILAQKADAPATENGVTGEANAVIVRTKDGYEPKDITIKKGDIVEFKNESGEYHWPASDLHPTHGIYPEFDPLRPIADGESWKFQFDKVGVWKFHDHIRANKVGTITVVE